MTPEVTGDEIQLENGEYMRVANRIIEIVARLHLPGLEIRAILFLLRQTYGWQKKEDEISLSQWMVGLDANRHNTIDALDDLLKRNIFNRSAHGQSFVYSFNKYVETWDQAAFGKPQARARTTSTPQGTGTLQGTSSTSTLQDTRTSTLQGTKTSTLQGTHKRKKETLKDINRAPTKPKTVKPRDPLLDNPAVMLYREVIERTANNVQREVIAATVTDLDRWREVLREWKAHGWKPDNVPGMIDRYKGGSKGSGPIRSNGNGQQGHTGSIASEANRVENERRAAIPANRTPRARPGGNGSGTEVPGMPGPPGSATPGPSG